ncbi:MAG: methyltransferase domain-containing protein [Gallionella sp.]|nr:methyltransferase domain-containing protein [Gallionella sp.]
MLEVGSGGNPYFRANVLLDAYEETRERHWAPLIHDRPTVLGFVEQLPFRDKAFDFVIASHVLEHSPDPARFLAELQRVARAGYIEVPDALMERINPYRDHRLEITVRDGRLVIKKKGAWCVDEELVELYEHRVKRVLTQETMRRHPFDFHVRYYWEDKIEFEVLNPGVDAGWVPPVSGTRVGHKRNLRQKTSTLLMKGIRSIFSQRRRNKGINLIELLMCPVCKSTELSMDQEKVCCKSCAREFPVRNGIPDLSPPKTGTQG